MSLLFSAFSLSPTLSRWERELGQARVPLDSFSLREKVAEGRMRVNYRMFFCNGHCLIAGLASQRLDAQLPCCVQIPSKP
jgi:hypothetical protein